MNKNLYKLGSGPCVKHELWQRDSLDLNLLGRSHRCDEAKVFIKNLIEKQRLLLNIPPDYYVAIVPGSATGAMEMLMWCLLGRRSVDALVMDPFSELWAYEINNKLKLHTEIFKAKQLGYLPEYNLSNNNDLVFTLSATTTGAGYNHLNWLKARTGLILVDATAAAFCVPIDFSKLDAVAYSWQKGLGGEAGQGMIVLSPKALLQLSNFKPPWPIPNLLSLWARDGEIREDTINKLLFEGYTLNTPPWLALIDLDQNLKIIERLGGIAQWYKAGFENTKFILDWVNKVSVLSTLTTADSQICSGSVCFQINSNGGSATDQDKAQSFEIYKKVAHLLEKFGVVDIVNHARSDPSFRIWCGPTQSMDNLKQFVKLFEEHILKKT